eukprot:CAMPEP_0175173970 /NCGR_PEP_ID=MMETSP0087-20121206/32359_1 /TAXON_ID=136419 /ORGANISM="Unknown Unknown, Strain D1" /LENGTH=38 /DNA_ID= /DNA_START= /DNA_END= /DNA_ORIENTATION=
MGNIGTGGALDLGGMAGIHRGVTGINSTGGVAGSAGVP